MIASLSWLARHQNRDGSWSATGYVGKCKKTCAPNPGRADFDAGVTGLSLLAFLGAGYYHLSKDTYDSICFGDVVRRALIWIMANQDPDGFIGSREAKKHTYSHAVCSTALSEAYGLTGSSLFKRQAQRAVDFVIASQNPGLGWRYKSQSGDNDTSVTGWAVMALKSAQLSGLAFPRSGYDGARAWFDRVTEPSNGRAGYHRRGTGKMYVAGVNEQFDHHETLTAVTLLSRIFMDRQRTAGVEFLLRDPPRWEGNRIDFYYWYCASLALFQIDGPAGRKWKTWSGALRNALMKHQNPRTTGCRRGSWEPVGRWCPEGGRVYATAINALTLEVNYRYANVMGMTQ